MSTVLENYYDPNYEPTQQEIEDYGRWLDLKLPEENHLLWIAREGLKAPLPENWKACKSEKGELYYFNFRTGQSIWDHPSDDQYKQLVKTERAKLQSAASSNSTPTPTAAATKSSKSESEKPKEDGKSLPQSAGKSTDSDSASTESKPKPKESKAAPVLSKESSEEAESHEDGEAADRKGTKLAQLKVLKRSTQGVRKSTVTVIEEPTVTAVPHAKTPSTELAPVLKKKELPAPMAPQQQAQVDSPQPKNPKTVPKVEEAQPAPVAKQTSGQTEEERLEQEKAAAQANFDKLLRQAKEQLAENHNRKVEAIIKEYDKKLEDVKNSTKERHTAELKKFSADSEAKLKASKAEIEAKCASELADKKKRTEEEMQATFIKEMATVRQQFDEKIENARKLQDAEIKAAQVAHASGKAQSLIRESVENVEALLEAYSKDVRQAIDKSYETELLIRLKELTNSTQEQLAKTNKESEAKIEREKAAAARAVDLYRSEVQQLMDEERRASEERLQRLQEANSKERERMMERHSQAINDMTQSQREEKLRLEKVFNDEIQFLRAAHSQRLAELQEEMEKAFVARKSRGKTSLDPQAAEEELSHVQSASEGDSDGAAGVDLLRQMPTPIPESTHPSAGHTGNSKPNPTNDHLGEFDSEKLRATICEVLQSVLKSTHPLAMASVAAPAAPSESDEETENTPVSIPKPLPLQTTGTKKQAVLVDVSNQAAGRKATVLPADSRSNVPLSLAEQQALLDQEQVRVGEAREYFTRQARLLAERRMKLKTARRNWKQDVLDAKARGVRADTADAALLRKIQRVLDQQAAELARDESILENSENWLQLKEAMVSKLRQDLEMNRDCDFSTLSIDTNVLMAPLREMEPLSGKVGKAPPPALLLPRSALKESKAHRSRDGQEARTARSRPTSTSSPSKVPEMKGIVSRLDTITQLLVDQKSSKSRSRSSSRHRYQRHVDFAAGYPHPLPQ